MKKVSNALKNYIVDAILLIVLGLVMLIWPKGTLKTIFTFLGIALIAMGAVKSITFFVKKDKDDRNVLDLLVGIAQIAVGIIFIVKADYLIAFFPIVAAVILAYGAIVMIIRAVKMRADNVNAFTVSLVLGIVTLVLAVIVFIHPIALSEIMLQTAGVSMIVEGISLLIVLSRKAG